MKQFHVRVIYISLERPKVQYRELNFNYVLSGSRLTPGSTKYEGHGGPELKNPYSVFCFSQGKDCCKARIFTESGITAHRSMYQDQHVPFTNFVLDIDSIAQMYYNYNLYNLVFVGNLQGALTTGKSIAECIGPILFGFLFEAADDSIKGVQMPWLIHQLHRFTRGLQRTF